MSAAYPSTRHAGIMSRRVRSLRRSAGVTQVELAEAAGVCVASVRRAESGESLPRPQTMARLLVALDAPGRSGDTWPVFLKQTPYRRRVAQEVRILRELNDFTPESVSACPDL